MKQFNNKFKVYSDNVDIYETIIATKGVFHSLDPTKIINELCEYNIFYTLSKD